MGSILRGIGILLLAWLVIGISVGRFRQPYLTETELFLCIHEHLLFKECS